MDWFLAKAGSSEAMPVVSLYSNTVPPAAGCCNNPQKKRPEKTEKVIFEQRQHYLRGKGLN
jgi:hypothetical protein